MSDTKAVASLLETAIVLYALAFPCLALAWDGLIRRRVAFPFPFGRVARGRSAIIWGVVGLLMGLFIGYFAVGFLLLSISRCDSSPSCFVSALSHVGFFAWAILAGLLGYLLLIWFWVGDANKRILTWGVWYDQARVAKILAAGLAQEGLPELPPQRLYRVETAVVRLFFAHGWAEKLARGENLPHGLTRDDTVRTAVTSISSPMTTSERAAVRLMAEYILDEAPTGASLSPLARWWVQSGQLIKTMNFGGVAI